MNRLLRAACCALLALFLLVIPVAAGNADDQATTAGLTLYAQGAAVYYDPSFDFGGWDAIVHRHMRWGQMGNRFVYRQDGHWCVQPDFPLGSVLTLRNARTGTTLTCTVGDAVAAQDQAHWRATAVVELAWKTFSDLGLTSGNDVQVYYLPNG